MEEQKTEQAISVEKQEIEAIKDLHMQLIMRLAVIEGILVKKNIISLEDISQEEGLVLEEIKAGLEQSKD